MLNNNTCLKPVNMPSISTPPINPTNPTQIPSRLPNPTEETSSGVGGGGKMFGVSDNQTEKIKTSTQYAHELN